MIDIFPTGGSLAKLAYTATVQRKTSLVSDDTEINVCIFLKLGYF
jgi:hypothetical protein